MSAPAEDPCTLGVLAFGDSITNAGGELQWGVALQSWALWTARGLGLPYTGHAIDGATIDDVLGVEIPRHEQSARYPDRRYELGCLYIGVNDVRGFDWDPVAFESGFADAVRYLSERCDRVLTPTAPLDLGRPRAGAKVKDLNRIIERVASRAGALVVDLRDFGARNHVMTDHVHPTAFGQIAIAQRALRVLEADGLPARVAPATLIRYQPSRRQRLRGDCTYAYRHAKVSLRALALRLGGWRWERLWR